MLVLRGSRIAGRLVVITDRSVKEECLAKVILLGEDSLRRNLRG